MAEEVERDVRLELRGVVDEEGDVGESLRPARYAVRLARGARLAEAGKPSAVRRVQGGTDPPSLVEREDGKALFGELGEDVVVALNVLDEPGPPPQGELPELCC